jgi:hypothetical protein
MIVDGIFVGWQVHSAVHQDEERDRIAIAQVFDRGMRERNPPQAKI